MTGGRSVPVDVKGNFVVRRPFPGLTPTIWRDEDRYTREYWNRIPRCYYTGDGAIKDADGYIWFVGRVDEVIKIAAHRIGTIEIESALLSHPAVAEAAVVGKPKYPPIDELKETLRGVARKILGPIVVIDNILFVSKVPKTRSGKIARARLASGALGKLEAKTANGLLMYGRRYEIVAVIDETTAGKDAGEVTGIKEAVGIPVVDSLEDALPYVPEALLIGIAPVGGALPTEWRVIIKNAISHKLDIISGLHYFLSDDSELRDLANNYGVNLLDVRKPPPDIKERIWTGMVRKIKVPIVTILSTDICAGKNVVTIELLREAEKRGFDPGFVATGQTMQMIGADAGANIDAIPGDFMVGQVEKMVLDVAKKPKDLIFVEGQGALSHPWVGHETLAVILGSWPDAVVLAHNPFLRTRYKFPEFGPPSPNDEIKKIVTIFPETRVIGIGVNGFKKNDEEIRRACEKIEAETGLPTTDVYRFGAEKLFDALIEYLKTVKKGFGVKFKC